MSTILRTLGLLTLVLGVAHPLYGIDGPLAVATKAIDGPSPMTGLVLWEMGPDQEAYSASVSLEFRYFTYDEVASGTPAGGFRYDWAPVHRFLDGAASRGHHAVLRFRDTDPVLGRPGVPASIRGLVRSARFTEGIPGTGPTKVFFPDWSQPALGAFILDFYRALGREIEGKNTPLAFLQVGFGLWGEYHLGFDGLEDFSDPALTAVDQALGRIFPSKADQTRLLGALAAIFKQTPWALSIDSANPDYSPFTDDPSLKSLGFGVFDDSFLSEDAEGYNASGWAFFPSAPMTVNGGEISYYTTGDQQKALAPQGPHGISLTRAAALRHLTYLLANDQPEYRTPAEVAAASRALGYRFQIEAASVSGASTQVTVRNTGVAVVPFDVYPALGPVRSVTSLRGLGPGQSRSCTIAAAGPGSTFWLDSPRLLPGQVIPFEGTKGTN